MGHLFLPGDSSSNTNWTGISLPFETSLAIIFDETGPHTNLLPFLVLRGTTSVSIASNGVAGGFNVLNQLAEKGNVLTTVTISGSEFFKLYGTPGGTGHSNSADGVVTDIGATATSPTKIHSSLSLIDASATTGGVNIGAGATNTSGNGSFGNGASLNPNITITYTGLKIKGGSGTDFIENDAKNGIVIDGNGNGDTVVLGASGMKAILGTGTSDQVIVGSGGLGNNQSAGSAINDKVTFGDPATAFLTIGPGAQVGSTAGTTSIGLTKVMNAAAGMTIDFYGIKSTVIVDMTNFVAGVANLTAAENQAIAAMGGLGVAYFNFRGNEYFIATNSIDPPGVSPEDAIVKLVGVHDLSATMSSGGLVTLHA
jgi:hypothetical protein